jgi:hypothetical protein
LSLQFRNLGHQCSSLSRQTILESARRNQDMPCRLNAYPFYRSYGKHIQSIFSLASPARQATCKSAY